MNCTLVSADALLGATVCATTRDTVSSVRHIAEERAVEAMAPPGRKVVQGRADEVQVGCRTETQDIVCGR